MTKFFRRRKNMNKKLLLFYHKICENIFTVLFLAVFPVKKISYY